jgi:hypothetical protein
MIGSVTKRMMTMATITKMMAVRAVDGRRRLEAGLG